MYNELQKRTWGSTITAVAAISEDHALDPKT